MMKLPIVLVPHPHVRLDEHTLGGSPHVADSRVPVRRLWAFYRGGASVEKILRWYPQLAAAKVLDALAFALDNPEVMEADIRQEDAFLSRAGHKPSAAARSRDQMDLPFKAPAEPPDAGRKSRG